MFLTTINLEIKTLAMATTIGISLPFDLVVFSLISHAAQGTGSVHDAVSVCVWRSVALYSRRHHRVFLGAIVLDYQFRGTYWVVAHFHYVMFGGATALIGAVYYWFPKMTGRMYGELLGKLHFALFFIGFNAVYMSMFLAWETPRRVLNTTQRSRSTTSSEPSGRSSSGSPFFIMFYNLAKSYVSGPKPVTTRGLLLADRRVGGPVAAAA